MGIWSPSSLLGLWNSGSHDRLHTAGNFAFCSTYLPVLKIRTFIKGYRILLAVLKITDRSKSSMASWLICLDHHTLIALFLVFLNYWWIRRTLWEKVAMVLPEDNSQNRLLAGFRGIWKILLLLALVICCRFLVIGVWTYLMDSSLNFYVLIRPTPDQHSARVNFAKSLYIFRENFNLILASKSFFLWRFLLDSVLTFVIFWRVLSREFFSSDTLIIFFSSVI